MLHLTRKIKPKRCQLSNVNCHMFDGGSPSTTFAISSYLGKSNPNTKKVYNLYNNTIRESGAGFTLVEIIVYVALLSLVLLLASSFVFYISYSNSQTKGDRELLENARRVLEEISYEISGAHSVYAPTTSANQLSLQTLRYLPSGETTSYIDFFVCGTRICLKKESQNPIYLTSDTVKVTGITFTQITTNGSVSMRVNIIMSYKNPINDTSQSVDLTSTASLRSY